MAEENETMEEEIEKVNKIVFEYNGTKYTMEFDRDTVSQVEKLFDLTTSDIMAGKFTAFYGLFYGSLLKHHPKIKGTTVDMFIKMFPDKKGIYRALSAMYLGCINTVLEEPDEESGNVISWKTM